MKHLRHVWIIAVKDLKIFATDRASVFFFIIFPFLFITLFYFIMSGSFGEDTRLEIHLATQEAAGGLSQQIIGAIETKDPSALAPGDPIIIWRYSPTPGPPTRGRSWAGWPPGLLRRSAPAT
jgi:hypothetical protein